MGFTGGFVRSPLLTLRLLFSVQRPVVLIEALGEIGGNRGNAVFIDVLQNRWLDGKEIILMS